MSAKVFFDTGIVVAALDATAGERQRAAQAALHVAAAGGRAVLSTQVLEEFYVAVTRALDVPLAPAAAAEALRQLARLPVVQLRPETLVAAAARSEADALAFRDALVVEAALDGGCALLYSDTLADGRRYGGLTVVNPLRPDRLEA